MVLESMRSPSPLTITPPLALVVATGISPAVNRAISNRTTSACRSSKKLIGCRRVIDNCCNRDAAAACRCSDVNNADSATANAVD